MDIITNNHWRPFVYGYDVPEDIKNNDFDWLDDDDGSDGFIHYRKRWYHVSEFIRISNHPDDNFSSWHGYHSDSHFSGILIRLSDCEDSYQIATYIS